MSRFDIGWLLGGAIIMAYHELRPSLPFWLLVMVAVVLTIVGSRLAKKYLAE